MRPAGRATLREAAAIPGCSVTRSEGTPNPVRLAKAGAKNQHQALSQAHVEQLACQLSDWRHHLREATSYWVTCRDAAALLAISTARVKQRAASSGGGLW